MVFFSIDAKISQLRCRSYIISSRDIGSSWPQTQLLRTTSHLESGLAAMDIRHLIADVEGALLFFGTIAKCAKDKCTQSENQCVQLIV